MSAHPSMNVTKSMLSGIRTDYFHIGFLATLARMCCPFFSARVLEMTLPRPGLFTVVSGRCLHDLAAVSVHKNVSCWSVPAQDRWILILFLQKLLKNIVGILMLSFHGGNNGHSVVTRRNKNSCSNCGTGV